MYSFNIITITGDIFTIINHKSNILLNQLIIKNIFQKFIKTDKYYMILNNDKPIYTNLFDFTNNTPIIIINLSIVFLNYLRKDIVQLKEDLLNNVFHKLRNNNELQNDKLIMHYACKQNIKSLKYASNILQNDKEFILNIIKECNNAYKLILFNFKLDKDIIISAVKRDTCTFEYIMNIIKNNEELYSNNYFCKNITELAVTKNPMALEYAFDIFKNNKNIVLKAIKKNSYVLKFASETLRNDQEVVLSAVYKHGNTLEFASETLRNDKEIVLVAVKHNRYAFTFASDILKYDKDIIYAKLSPFEKEIIIKNTNKYQTIICHLLQWIIVFIFFYNVSNSNILY